MFTWVFLGLNVVTSLLGSTRILSLWDKFSKHPTVQQLGDSSVATVALAQNMHKLQSWSKLSWRPSAVESTGVILGLVAVHIRRGDYLGEEGKNNGHCVGLSDWGSSFTGTSMHAFARDLN